MSPVSSRKVCARGARVQVPFTSSDTRTCSGALYWPNHPTSRSPWATGRVSGTVTVETRAPVPNAVPWTRVGVVDRATAARENRTPRLEITARQAVDRADGEHCMVIQSFAITLLPVLHRTPGSIPDSPTGRTAAPSRRILRLTGSLIRRTGIGQDEPKELGNHPFRAGRGRHPVQHGLLPSPCPGGSGGASGRAAEVLAQVPGSSLQHAREGLRPPGRLRNLRVEQGTNLAPPTRP